MFDRSRPLVASRLFAGAAIVALAVAACGSSASPSPTASTQAPEVTPAPTAPPAAAPTTAGGGAVTAGCADPVKVAEALKETDHYIAAAKISAALPVASGESPGFSMNLDMTLKHQKPDRIEISSGMGGGATLFAMRQIGKESWIAMFGSDTWSKSDSTGDETDFFGSKLDTSTLTPLAEIPADLVLPGSSSCVIGYSLNVPDATAGDASNPLSSLSGATAFAMRVDTSTGLPESMGFQIDTAQAGEGAPTSMVFVFDYQTPVQIDPPDPSKVTEGGGGGLPFPSGLELPSGIPLPSGLTLP